MRNDPEKASLLAHLSADRRYLAMLGLGFSAGIPYLLVYPTQSAWLSDAQVPIQTIGLMSELTIAYKFKFIWAPFLDKYDAPVFSALLGRRRGWIVLSQIAVMLALIGVAFGDPAHLLGYTVAFSLALGVAGATQDVTIDGWRITSVPVAKQSVMTAISEMGYRVGNLAAGAGALAARRQIWLAYRLCLHGGSDADRSDLRFRRARARFRFHGRAMSIRVLSPRSSRQSRKWSRGSGRWPCRSS